MNSRTAWLSWIFVWGCATGTPPSSTGFDGPTAPAPFSADAIRQATREGRTYLFQVESPDKPMFHRRMRFENVSDDGATVVTQALAPDGTPLFDSESSEVTWTDLVGHATYPMKDTAITESSIEIKSGKYDCFVYTVSKGIGSTGQRIQAYFAKNLPGAPVLHIVEVGGTVITKTTLVEHTPGE